MEPQDLVTWSPRQKGYCIQSEMLDQIRQLKKPLVIIGITGQRKSGKTFLINQIAGKGPGKHLF